MQVNGDGDAVTELVRSVLCPPWRPTRPGLSAFQRSIPHASHDRVLRTSYTFTCMVRRDNVGKQLISYPGIVSLRIDIVFYMAGGEPSMHLSVTFNIYYILYIRMHGSL